MKVFIIGPEGTGKTVFATMLNHFIEQHQETTGLTFRAGDRTTKSYFAKERRILASGEWPGSTVGGKLVKLNWKWDTADAKSEITLIDPPGQDIRRELCGQNATIGIVDEIKNAEILILIVDIVGDQGQSDETRTDNAWIIEHVLELVSEQQYVIFAVSKADLLTYRLPEQAWSDRDQVLAITRAMMPELKLASYLNKLPAGKSSVLAFSAVDTQNQPHANQLRRVPAKPLTSVGMDKVVDAIKAAMAWSEQQKRTAHKKLIQARLRQKAKKIGLPSTVALGLIIVVYVAYFLIRSS